MVPGVLEIDKFSPWWGIFERKIIFGPWDILSYQNGPWVKVWWKLHIGPSSLEIRQLWSPDI